MPGLSVVVPVYGCTDCLRALHARLTATLTESGVEWEIVYVDDCSPGESWPLLVDLARGDPRVRAYHLSHNAGQSAAIMAGLARTRGERVVVMDCDLQDPPEAIPLLLARAKEGHDAVFTTRGTRSYGLARRLGTAAYFRLRNLVSEAPLPRYSGYSLVSRRVVEAVLSSSNRHRTYLMSLRYLTAARGLGFSHAVVPVRRDERHAGESSYTLRSLTRVAAGNLLHEAAVKLRRALPAPAARWFDRVERTLRRRPAVVVDMEAAAGAGLQAGASNDSEPVRAR